MPLPVTLVALFLLGLAEAALEQVLGKVLAVLRLCVLAALVDAQYPLRDVDLRLVAARKPLVAALAAVVAMRLAPLALVGQRKVEQPPAVAVVVAILHLASQSLAPFLEYVAQAQQVLYVALVVLVLAKVVRARPLTALIADLLRLVFQVAVKRLEDKEAAPTAPTD